jgi:predicted PurR-regulated permease PerM
MASIVLLVMTVIFMLFEVRHLPYKLRFALNNPRLHIAGLHRALKGVTHYLALKTLISLWTGLIVWLGLLAMGVQFALMGGAGVFAELCAEHWLRHLRYPPDAAGAAVQRHL